MSERFSDSLRATAALIWEAIFRHPFLSQLEAGTLAEIGVTNLMATVIGHDEGEWTRTRSFLGHLNQGRR
jgi:hypothetical protein